MSKQTPRKAAMDALSAGRVSAISIVEDDGYSAFRILVNFKHTDGHDYCYQSKPFSGTDYQDLAKEAAKRIERMGLPRKYVVQWVENHFERSKIDFAHLFG